MSLPCSKLLEGFLSHPGENFKPLRPCMRQPLAITLTHPNTAGTLEFLCFLEYFKLPFLSYTPCEKPYSIPLVTCFSPNHALDLTASERSSLSSQTGSYLPDITFGGSKYIFSEVPFHGLHI